jgi:hypothetical protein
LNEEKKNNRHEETMIINPVLLMYNCLNRPLEENINRIDRANGINILVGNDFFPTEIFYIILEFYTSSVKGLLTFKTIFRNWKYIGETSLIWLSCKLEFSAPRAYRESCTVVFMPGHHPRSDAQVLSMGMIESKFPKVVRVEIERSGQDELSPFDRSKAWHDCFIANLRGYNKAWNSYARWKSFSDRMEIILKPLLMKTTIYSFSFGALASFPSVYLLQDLSISTSLTIKQQMGFFCLYLILVSYLPSHIVSILSEIFLPPCEHSSPYLEIQLFRHKDHLINFIQLTFLIALLASVILVHLKFTSLPEIPWTITTIPLWVMILFILVEYYFFVRDQTNRRGALGLSALLGFLMIISVLPLCLAGYFYDNSNGNDSNNLNLQLKYMSIFYYPHALVLTAFVFNFIYDMMWWLQGRAYVRPASEDKRIGYLRFFLYSCSMVCCAASCLILYILLISLWMSSPSSFFPLTSIEPAGLLFLLLACLHVSFVTYMLERELDHRN